MNKLIQQKVVVIGGSSGIGLAAAKQAFSEGAQIVLGGRSQAKLDTAKQSLSSHAQMLTVEMSEEESLRRFFQQIGKFDHLVITGASPTFMPLKEFSLQKAQRDFNAKFWGQYVAVVESLPYLNKQGSIVLMSGGYSLRPDAGSSVMSAANGAIEALTRALAIELSPIRVNAVSPGFVNTPLVSEMMSEEARAQVFKQIESSVPVRRVAQPEDIGEAILFLLTNKNMSGNTVHIDGGITLV